MRLSRPTSQRSKVLCILVLSMLEGGTVFAASGREGAAFLNIPVGAAPAALGGAYSALAVNAYAPIWNAAGLGFVQSPEVAGQHLSYLEAMNYEQASVVVPFGQATRFPNGGALGLSAQYLGSGDLTGRGPGGEKTGDFTSHYGAYTLAYGRRFQEWLALGVGAKWIQARIADYSAKAYAVDFGSLVRVRDNLDLALTLTNFGSKLDFINEGDALPAAAHAGLRYRPTRPIELSVEGAFPTADSASAHFGAEWQPLDLLAIRVGYRTDHLKELSALAGFSTGVGLRLWGQEFSYAWVPYGDLGDTQYFSILLRFGAPANPHNLTRTSALNSTELMSAENGASVALTSAREARR